MSGNELDKKLAALCKSDAPDLDEMQDLIMAGADVNQLNEYGENIFEDVFIDILYNDRDEAPLLFPVVEKIKDIIRLLVDHGWDIKKYGLSTTNQFKFTFNVSAFDLYRFMLQYDIFSNPQDCEDMLEGLATEESFQCCCEHDHDLENLFHALYEMVYAKKEGRNYLSIEPYYDAVGLTIDKVLYFGNADTMTTKEKFTEFGADIAFVCGEKLLVLRDSVNILFMNDRLSETPQIDISLAFGQDVIGRSITAISFGHRNVVKETSNYGQATIILELNSGKKVKFTHNFGEMEGRNYQSRFWVE